MIAVLANKTDTALRLFQIALEANPNIEQYWHSYVDTLVKTDQLQTAKKIVKMAEGKGFDTKKLEALLHQSVDQTISQGPLQAQIGAILEHYQNESYPEAEELANNVNARISSASIWLENSWRRTEERRQIDESIVASQKSVYLAPGDTEAHSNLGKLRELGRLEEAVVSFNEAIALKPDSAIAHSNLGYTLKELGKLDEAEASLTRAIALQPDSRPTTTWV